MTDPTARAQAAAGLPADAALHQLTACEQAAAVRGREISPAELIEHYLDRISSYADTVGAFVTVTAERALDAAKAATQQTMSISASTSGPSALPPLLGVPTAIKDLNAVAGVPMKLGSLAFADLIPGWDDNSVLALRAAGAISLGKTNTPELGLPCYTEPDDSIAPPARTPWDLTRSAGGSSGGAAAAVAAGLVPFALGSDGGGSIRIPASVCGLVGLKTARGRVSGGPLGGDGAGLGVQGPLARTVADVGLLLDVLAGPWTGDPTWAPPLPPGESFLAAARRDPPRLRIGRYLENIFGAPVDPACRTAWDEASALLASLGHEVEDIPVPPFGRHYPHFVTLWSVGAAGAAVPPEREHLLRPLTRWLRDRGARVPATTYAAALLALQQASRAHLLATEAYDVVLTPTLAQPPAPVGALRNDPDPAADFEAQGRFTPYTSLYNITGQPALSFPLHVADGLPIGVQLVGRPAAEALLLSLGHQLETARPDRALLAPGW